MAKTVAISSAAAISTKIPTNACCVFEPTMPSSAALPRLAARSFRQHLKIIHFIRHFRLRDAVEELADARLYARAHLGDRAIRNDIPLVDQNHPVRNQKSAGQLVRDHDDRHSKCALQ